MMYKINNTTNKTCPKQRTKTISEGDNQYQKSSKNTLYFTGWGGGGAMNGATCKKGKHE